jgi:TonB-dependent SusC/RagA subfamily outer membrane receptor
MKTKIALIIVSLIFSVAASTAQSGKKIQVTGKITDASQAPVEGVMIFADNQNTGKVSDKNGLYKVKVPANTKSIRVMTLTGGVAEAPLDGKTVVDFSFAQNLTGPANKSVKNEKAEEEKVNIGYGTVDKKDLLTPVSKIDSKKDTYVYKDIYEMLKGKPGVQVTGRTIKIQGASSFMSGTDPLFVVDGVITEQIDNISPQQVKSIEILKGSSASIYGSRGANGVILISLKKGE